MGIIFTILIGFVAGLIAKFLMPGDNDPSGFILTTILGIVGAFVATFLGQAIGWYRAGEGAGLIGAIIVLAIWGCHRPTAYLNLLIRAPAPAHRHNSCNLLSAGALKAPLHLADDRSRS